MLIGKIRLIEIPGKIHKDQIMEETLVSSAKIINVKFEFHDIQFETENYSITVMKIKPPKFEPTSPICGLNCKDIAPISQTHL